MYINLKFPTHFYPSQVNIGMLSSVNVLVASTSNLAHGLTKRVALRDVISRSKVQVMRPHNVHSFNLAYLLTAGMALGKEVHVDKWRCAAK